MHAFQLVAFDLVLLISLCETASVTFSLVDARNDTMYEHYLLQYHLIEYDSRARTIIVIYILNLGVKARGKPGKTKPITTATVDAVVVV